MEPNDETRPTPERSDGTASVHLPSMRRASPWSRRLFLIVVIVVALFMPIWLDPVTLDQFRGATPFPVPTLPPDAVPTAGFSPGAEELFEVSTTVARDGFDRAEADGWGVAEIGGSYTALGPVGLLATESGAGVGLVDPSAPGGVALSGVAAHDVEVLFDVSGDGLAASGVHVSALLRQLADGTGYRPTILVGEDGTPQVTVRAIVGDTETALVPAVTLPGATQLPAAYRVRAQAIGSDPTTIRMRAWPVDEPEPLVWQVSVIDWTGSLQRAGSIGFAWGSTTDNTTGATDGTLHFDDLLARANAPESSL